MPRFVSPLRLSVLTLVAFSASAPARLALAQETPAPATSASTPAQETLPASLPIAAPASAPDSATAPIDLSLSPAKAAALDAEKANALLDELSQDFNSYHTSPFDELFWRGYGELNFTFYNYGLYQTEDSGSPADRRATIDVPRFVLELELEKAPGIEVEAEIEFEHGGAGASMELDYNEEFGEYEQEIEKGGEVNVEALYILRQFNSRVTVLGGRLYVASGLLSGENLERPVDYLGAARPESETTLVPGVWDELGVELRLTFDRWRWRTQVVSGLDSSAFSTDQWIGAGQQQRFETVVANRPALVTRIDYIGARGISAGVSAYVGDAAGNRPKPDMEGVMAPLTLLDAHLRLRRGPLTVNGLAMWGHLEQADVISEVNARLPNQLGVDRTAVGDNAVLGWLEVGWNLAPLLNLNRDRLEPYLRAEYYDTLFNVRDSLYDNPRMERRILAGGVSWQFSDALVAKVQAAQRSFGASALRPERTLSTTFGFVF